MSGLTYPPGVPDAPSDGELYARLNAAWQDFVAGIADAPADGDLYARLDNAWEAFVAGIPDAPNDGNYYARKDLDWESFVPGGGGGPTLIAQLIAPTAGAFNFTGLNFSPYRQIQIVLEDIQFSVVGSPGLKFDIGGVLTTNQFYFSSRSGASSGANETAAGAAVATVLLLDDTSNNWWVVSTTTDADADYNGIITIVNPNSSKHRAGTFNGNSSRGASGTAINSLGGFVARTTGVIDGVHIISAQGTISSGKVSIYGTV
jgi:hypothetical protein